MPAPHWFYANIQYQGYTVGLLIQTADQDEAWHEAEVVCDDFSDQAILLDVQKVVIQ